MKPYALALLVLVSCFAAETRTGTRAWEKVKKPLAGDAVSIGSYMAGCLRGAVALPPKSPDYVMMRPHRHRNYGHPLLLSFIKELALKARAAQLGPVLVGDMGQPRGGPSRTGHSSHQNGLDVDIWFWLPKRRLSWWEREHTSAPRMVVPDFEKLDQPWQPEVIDLLRLAAQSPLVERMFVNPIVKKEVCSRFAGSAWVGKLRPWFAHDDHFHARLRCPEGDKQCKPQDPIPPGDGCGTELTSWLSEQSKAKARKLRSQPSVYKEPVLPEACSDVLRQ